jgi:hypothetical protein
MQRIPTLTLTTLLAALACPAPRLAAWGEGALMLRDLWYTAWVRSAAPLPKFETALPVNTTK